MGAAAPAPFVGAGVEAADLGAAGAEVTATDTAEGKFSTVFDLINSKEFSTKLQYLVRYITKLHIKLIKPSTKFSQCNNTFKYIFLSYGNFLGLRKHRKISWTSEQRDIYPLTVKFISQTNR